MIFKKLTTLKEVLLALAHGYTVVEPDGSILRLGKDNIERIDVENLIAFGDIDSKVFDLSELKFPCTIYEASTGKDMSSPRVKITDAQVNLALDTFNDAMLTLAKDSYCMHEALEKYESSRARIELNHSIAKSAEYDAKVIKEFGDRLLRTCEMSIENGGNDVEFKVYLGGCGPGSHKDTTLPTFIKGLSYSAWNELRSNGDL